MYWLLIFIAAYDQNHFHSVQVSRCLWYEYLEKYHQQAFLISSFSSHSFRIFLNFFSRKHLLYENDH
jgi:hypothetical protein